MPYSYGGHFPVCLIAMVDISLCAFKAMHFNVLFGQEALWRTLFPRQLRAGLDTL